MRHVCLGFALSHPNASPQDAAAVQDLLEALANKRRPFAIVIIEGHRQRTVRWARSGSPISDAKATASIKLPACTSVSRSVPFGL